MITMALAFLVAYIVLLAIAQHAEDLRAQARSCKNSARRKQVDDSEERLLA